MIKVDYGEKGSPEQCEKFWRSIWDRERKCWHLRYDRIQEPGMTDSDQTDIPERS